MALHGINIKPANKGKLHAELAKAKRSSSPAERKRATFAENAKKWNHGGKTVGKPSTSDKFYGG